MNRKHQQSIYHANVNLNLMKGSVIQINGLIAINVAVIVKKHHICEKDYMRNLATCSCENGKHLASVIADSMILCDEIKDADAEPKKYDEAKSNNEETKTVRTNFNEKNVACKTQNFYILFAFLLITITL